MIVHIASGLGYVVACAAGCFFFLAACLRFGIRRHRALDSLSANAYSMYLNHYVIVVWLQFAVLGFDMPAAVKAAVVFTGTLFASWALAVAVGGIALGPLFAQSAGLGALGRKPPAKLVKQDDPAR
jgi:surface polysaccharide O-acyltransferase-like enzyme